MSVRRTVLGAVTAWLAVVALGSAVVWSVISRAGEEVAPRVGGEVVARADTGQPARSPHPARTPRPAPPSSSAARPSGTPSSPAPAPTRAPATTPGDPTSSPDPETEAAVDVQRRTWQGPGGFVSAECRGERISLQAAQADSGFSVEVAERGPETIHVHFEGREDEGRESEVEGRCRDGVPVFGSRSDD